MTFKQLSCQIDSIFLDDQYSPEKDIRLFVGAEFEKIRSTHYLAHTLSEDWPTAADIEEIVTKSSGQFIYAATVMRFIAHSPSSPILSLQRVQGIVSPAKNSPFAYLDAVYTYILSHVEDQEAIMSILTAKLLAAELTTIQTCLEVYHRGYSAILMNSCIAELAPIAHTRHEELVFYHASFSDFLQDKDRAEAFYIDLEAFCAAVFPKVWAVVPSLDWIRINTRIFAILALQKVQQPTPDITAALMNTDLSEFNDFDLRSRARDFITDIHRLYAPTNPESFSKIMQKWTSDNEAFGEFIPRDLTHPTVHVSVELGATRMDAAVARNPIVYAASYPTVIAADQTNSTAQMTPSTYTSPLPGSPSDFRTVPRWKRGMKSFMKSLNSLKGSEN